MDANKKWLSLSKDIRSQLLNNIWCSNCSDVTTIAGFIVENDELGIILNGKCKKCGHEVSRVVEIQ